MVPDRIVDFELLKIKRNMRKICNCENPQYEVDTNNRAVWCGCCGAWVDPFDAMLYLAEHSEKLEKRIDYLCEKEKDACERINKLNSEIEVLSKKRARLGVFKKLESEYRNDMVPYCPRCGQTFYFENIIAWRNRRYIEEETNE
jgi:hypothetical protein